MDGWRIQKSRPVSDVALKDLTSLQYRRKVSTALIFELNQFLKKQQSGRDTNVLEIMQHIIESGSSSLEDNEQYNSTFNKCLQLQ